MKSLEEIKSILNAHKEELRKRHKVKELGIFGSYVRNEQKEGSDVDILAEFENEMELGGFEYIGLMIDLEDYLRETLNIKPHLASKRHAMASDKWKLIKNEVVHVFVETKNANKIEI
ncbi:MAG: nucleotidyltransferase family protein [Halobacteriota archaeon]